MAETINIPFNKPFMTGEELEYIQQSVVSGKISGNGLFTQKCQAFFQQKYNFSKCLLTTSCTDALEMCALLLDIQAGDEVILPAYTFVSTANAFALRGAKLVFADSEAHHPNIDVQQIEALITSKTKAIVVVHYAGVACEMDSIMDLAQKYDLFVVEDAAQAIDAYYKERPLGSIGHLAAFSFHETKNIISGEGGMLVINDERFAKRAEIIWEKGTNRSAFFRGEVDKYGWVDLGSSFLPADTTAAFLYAQLESMEQIQAKRLAIWQQYYQELAALEKGGWLKLPKLKQEASNNGHMFYIICSEPDMRTDLIAYLKDKGVHAVFHYLPLQKSSFFHHKHDGRMLPYADHYSDCLLRLPLYYELESSQVSRICTYISEFCKSYVGEKGKV
jgi:dTDP-4-amino-4,6-dideoxygalactose transaminase